MMQSVKATTKDRSKTNAEVLVVNTLLQRAALSEAKRDFAFRDGKPYLKTAAEWLPSPDLVANEQDAGQVNTLA